uniref:Uncharacterized protein n=1 Tax=Rhizophora mucronata TaxID=61149 RepID=A0A2P2LI11_RHIMU
MPYFFPFRSNTLPSKMLKLSMQYSSESNPPSPGTSKQKLLLGKRLQTKGLLGKGFYKADMGG